MKKITAWFLLALLFGSGSAFGATSNIPCNKKSSELTHQIALVGLSHGHEKKLNAVFPILEIISSLTPKQVIDLDPQTVDLLIMLLEDEDDGVKMYAAHAISGLGARAVIALPSLEVAKNSVKDSPVDENGVVMSNVNRRDEIQNAIDLIKSKVKRASN